MRRIILAIRIFFRTLFSAQVTEQVAQILTGEALPAPSEEPEVEKERPERKPRPSARSDALTLLAALQREARFIDFVKEPIDSYSDAQIGAAARGVHKECSNVLDRMFALKPLVDDQEGASIELQAGFDAARFRLTGKVTDQPPFRGNLAHQGWEATKCDLPSWQGSEESAQVVAPAEVELK